MTAGDAARRAEPAVRRGAAGAEGRQAAEDRVPRVPVAAGERQDAAAIWRGRQRQPASCPACSSCTRTAGSTRTSRTSRAGWRSTTSWRSPPTRSRRSAATRATRTRRATLFPKLDQAKTREDFVAAAGFLKKRAGLHRQDRRGRLLLRRRHRQHAGDALAGSCAPRSRSTAASRPPKTSPKIKAPLLIHYAENDERINAGWPAVRDRAQGQQRAVHDAHYPGTQHGFNNDTTPRYDKAAAKLAWQRTLDLFNGELRK